MRLSISARLGPKCTIRPVLTDHQWLIHHLARPLIALTIQLNGVRKQPVAMNGATTGRFFMVHRYVVQRPTRVLLPSLLPLPYRTWHETLMLSQYRPILPLTLKIAAIIVVCATHPLRVCFPTIPALSMFMCECLAVCMACNAGTAHVCMHVYRQKGYALVRVIRESCFKLYDSCVYIIWSICFLFSVFI